MKSNKTETALSFEKCRFIVCDATLECSELECMSVAN